MQTALYFDPVNFASRITSPALAGFGFIDTTSPPAGIWTTLNQIAGPRTIADDRVRHNNLVPEKGRACPARTQQILDSLRSGAQFKPTF